MTHTFTNALAAVAALVLTVTSIGTIVSVPDASIHAAHNTMQTSELA